MSKILFVMPRLPFPPSSGSKSLLYNYCKIIKKLGYELIVASFLEHGDDPSEIPDFIDRLVVLPKIGSLTKALNIVAKTFLTGKFPMQVSLFWSRKADHIIKNLIQSEKPTIIIADMVRMTEYIQSADGYKIANLEDRLSIRYKRQLRTDLEGLNPYGAYLTCLPKFVRKILMKRNVKRKVLEKEISLLEKYELQMGEKCDSVIFVAKKEADHFNQLLKQNTACAIPMGVDFDYFSQSILSRRDRNKMVFVGALNVAHNENAVVHFIEDIFPIILQHRPYAQFQVVGGGITERLKKYAAPNVIFTGRVPDIRPYIQSGCVFVCPLTFGSGIKTKNLEAMAMGVPVVTTSIGAENIAAINHEDWLIADDNAEFANAVLRVLNSDSLYTLLSKNGIHFVKKNFSWDYTQDLFKELLRSAEKNSSELQTPLIMAAN